MKKFVALFLALTLTCGLAACGGGGNSGGGDRSEERRVGKECAA